MPTAPEDMTLEDYNLVCDGMTCRSLASPFTCQAPQGLFHHPNFPMVPVETTDCNPSVHYLDVVKNYRLDISLADLERKYKDAIINKDLQLLPEPELTEGSYVIIKHVIFPQKCKLSVMKNLAFGNIHRPLFMNQPTVGRKILQYCLQNLGGTHFPCFDLGAETAAVKNRKAFDDLEDDGLDKGFDFIAQHGPRSSCDLAQLR